jgi:hypothetical protein
MERKTYYEDDNFKVYLEEINDQVFIHVGIYNFSKAIFKEIKAVWARALVDIYFAGYEDVFVYTKDNRIVKLIGGATKIGQHQEYEVWKWDLS